MRYLFCLLVAGFLFTGCQTDGPSPVITTENGTRYSIYTADRAGEPVKAGEYIYFDAVMQTEADSTIFSTRDNTGEPQVVQITEDDKAGNAASPVLEILSLMAAGDSAVIRVSMDQFPNIPPGMENDTVMLYTIAVREVIDDATFSSRLSAEELAAKQAAEVTQAREEEMLAFADEVYNDYVAGALDADMKTTATGLKYVIHQEGEGAQAEAGKSVDVQYIGKLVTDGSVFDQSFGRGAPISFPLGQGRVIPGWDEGIALLKEGARATFFIPAELAYGPTGTPGIPPNSELAFYVELEKVQ